MWNPVFVEYLLQNEQLHFVKEINEGNGLKLGFYCGSVAFILEF